MFEAIKDFAKRILNSRLFVLGVVMLVLFALLLQRMFTLQIINGQSYTDKYTLTIKKERVTSGTRGNIYDRNGKLLAYNELSYSVTIEDSGTYSGSKEKNRKLNQELSEIIGMIESNGDSITNNFSIVLNANGEFEFNVSGTALNRFRADVYGYTSIDGLKTNKNKLGYEESEATAQQIIDFLCVNKKFGVHFEGVEYKDENPEDIDYYSREMAYKILTIRYAMSQNSYQKYILTTIATNVSDETVAMVKENSDHLEGADIADDTTRVYVDSEYFSHIIGWTGKISQEEYDELSEENDAYTLTDMVGKSGIEQIMEQTLQGSKGRETFYVDNVGHIVEYTDKVEATSGNDVYLSIDSDLQKVVYDMLERQIAGIVLSALRNVKEYNAGANASASDIIIPIDDAYFALINNNVINIDNFSQPGASEMEQAVYGAFQIKQAEMLEEINGQLSSGAPSSYEDLSEEMQIYMSYILTMLTEKDIFNSEAVDTEDEVHQSWKNNQTSLAEYLRHGIAKDWIDITGFDTESKYSDSMEIYGSLLEYIQEELKTDREFSKKIYKYMIHDDLIDGTQLGLILYDQGILEASEEAASNLRDGTTSSFTFMQQRIKNLEITPAQLALDPCTGSSVIVNPQTGELLACVSYPGYDTNRLANNMDSSYYNSLRTDLSLPMYSNATLQQTAPGSTFKPVTAAAGLTEGIITTETQIEDKGVFELVQDGPKCWKWPNGTHGKINVTEAIRDSCNYFFYTVGYNLSLNGDIYNEEKGTAALRKYAELFGLGEKTGVELPESEPKISDEYPITSAIGQGTNNYTTIGLARYTAAIASRGNVYQLTLLDKVTDSDGTVLEDYSPQVERTMDEIAPSSWDSIQNGMHMVVKNSAAFDGFPEEIGAAGKTGTAQQVKTRPNHALFIGYAPFNNPQIAIATRIAYGYTSANAAEVSRKIMEYKLNLLDVNELLNGQAADVGDSSNSFTD